ncbi:hypothetical protein [Chryseobacterium taklimakanense]|uniref:Uncharacterized protein n=1 Tax=Chryseobacterium taklimakanense TaxID=536441 RepID=A0A3G8WH17_9FLAO|nr:hypothetical protein [Chryseobacterium taklimakanense]AZI20480.1 hypothetical protein EIH08_06915 [Chryseobacterium taklimakanense]
MTSEQFIEKIKKEYIFDRFFNYVFAIGSLLGGFFLLYKILLTEWSKNFSLGLFIFTIILTISLMYIGVTGLMRTPNLADVDLIRRDSNVENNRNLVLEISKKLNLRLLPTENNDILKSETKNLFFEKRDLVFFINSEGIFLNIQQRNWDGPTFMGYFGTIKLKNKIIKLIKDSR